MKKSSVLLLWPAVLGSSNAFLFNPSTKATGNKLQHLIVQSSPLIGITSYTTSTRRNLHSQPTPSTQPPSSFQEEELTPETIAEMIEVSFLQSCLQLSRGYIDVLKLFIVAVKSGYEQGIPLEELHTLVVECPVNSAGRELMKEELELRREWMEVVYRMMSMIFPNKHGESDDDATLTNNTESQTTTRVEQVIDSMIQLQKVLQQQEDESGGQQDSKVVLTNLTVEKAMEKLPSLSQLLELTTDPVQKAFLVNDVRVALLTFKVVEEERVCLEDSRGSGRGVREDTIPRPPIKGT